MATQLVNGLGGAVGCRYLSTRNQLLFVEYNGKVSVVDLIRPLASTVSSGSTVLKGTWIMDLETGVQGGSAPPGDIWWEQKTAVARDMRPVGGAKIVNLGHVNYNAVTFASLQTLSFGTTPIPGNNDPSNQLTDGDVFAVLTNGGNYAKVQVLHYDYNMTIRWATYQLAPRYRVLGTGYTNPEDIAVTADETTAYVTERSGNLLRVSLSAANRASATVVASGLAAPQQMFLDEANHAAYLVEYAPGGRLLRIALPGGAMTTLASGLDHPVGVLVTSDRQTAYVGEQTASGGKVVKIDLATAARSDVHTGFTEPFFMTWTDASEERILITERGAARRLDVIDLTRTPAVVTHVATGLPTQPSSCAVISPSMMLVCCDSEIDAVEVPGISIVPTAPLFMGIGKVPFDRIRTAAPDIGTADTSVDPTYPYQFHHTPFGGTLPLLVNHQRAYLDGARFYRVLVDGVRRLDSWTDYHWNAALAHYEALTTDPQTVSVAGAGHYPVRTPSDLFLWLSPALGSRMTSVGLSNSMHSIQLEFVNALGALVETSGTVNILVNNQSCTAMLEVAKLGGVSADGCGLLRYTKDPTTGDPLGSVVMPVHVSHPANFANYSLTVYKGVNICFSSSGPVLGAPSSVSDTTKHLLGGCKIAGYAEYLYVAATMIDGEVRQSQYDASAALAFVLAPE
jgi:DNA-binding beta-propeller fold protein YncE